MGWDINFAILGGKVNKPPVLKESKYREGDVITFWTMTNSRYYRNGKGEEQEAKLYIYCKAQGTVARMARANLGKGDIVVVMGHLIKWKGDKRQEIQLWVERIAPFKETIFSYSGSYVTMTREEARTLVEIAKKHHEEIPGKIKRFLATADRMHAERDPLWEIGEGDT